MIRAVMRVFAKYASVSLDKDCSTYLSNERLVKYGIVW